MSRFLLAFVVLAFGLGHTFKFSFFSPDIGFTPLDVGIFVLVSFSITTRMSQLKIWLTSHRRQLLAMVVFSAVSLISLFISGSRFGHYPQFVAGLYWARWVFYSASAFCLGVLYSPAKLRRLILLLGATIVTTGLYQYAFFPDVRHLEVFGWDPHYFRVVAAWLDPGFTGLLLVFTLIYLTLNPLRHRFFQLFAWSAAYLTFALTYSRSSYAAFLISMGYISWTRRSWKLFIGVLLLFTATIYLLPRPAGEGVRLDRTASVFARLQNWQNSLTIISRYPWLGVGFNTYRYAQKEFGFLDTPGWLTSHAGAGADSSLLFVTATTGLIGLGVYLWYLRSLWMYPALRPVLAALLVHSLFLNSLFYPAVMLWLAILIAMIKARNSP